MPILNRFSMDFTIPTPNERRQNSALRDLFDEAYEICLPFIDPARGIAGKPLIHHAGVVVRESFPHLSAEEIMILVGAMQNAFKRRQAEAWRLKAS